MSGPLHGYRSAGGGRRPIVLSGRVVGENAAQGTEVGLLSGLGDEWAMKLADDAGGMFRLDGRRLVVGARPLDYATAPAPKLLVAATDGRRAAAELLTIEVRRPLPALPLAAGARVAAVGASVVAYDNTFGGAVGTGGMTVGTKAAISTGYGFVTQAKAHDPRFRFENWYDTADPLGRNFVGANQAKHGDHLEWAQAGFAGGIVARLAATLARRPDVVILDPGSNTISSGDDGQAGTRDYVVARLDRALGMARAAGVWIVPMTIYPRGDWEASPATYANSIQTIADVNAWIRAQAGREGVLAVLDAEPLLRPGGPGTALDLTLFKSDKVHLGPKGSLLMGRQRFLPIVQANIQAGSIFDRDPSVDNLCAPAIYNLPGTAGTKTNSVAGNTVTGNVATGFTLTRSRNCTLLASKELVAGALERQVIAVAPGGADSGNFGECSLSGIVAMEAANAEQWHQAFVEVETSGDGLAFCQLQGGHRLNTTAVTNAIAQGRESSADFTADATGGARTFWLQTEPFRSADGYDRLAFGLTLTFSKTAAPFTVKVAKPIVRRVGDPRPRWGY